jgi:hypothetical protein
LIGCVVRAVKAVMYDFIADYILSKSVI